MLKTKNNPPNKQTNPRQKQQKQTSKPPHNQKTLLKQKNQSTPKNTQEEVLDQLALLPRSKKKVKVLKSEQPEHLEELQTSEKGYVTCTVGNSLQSPN